MSFWFILILAGLFLSACAGELPPAGTATLALPVESSPTRELPARTPSASPSPSTTPLPSATASPTPPPTQTATVTPTVTATSTATATPVPTYVKLRGKVIIDQAVCHYGPGAPYLYKYGVYKGSNLEIIRREERSNYIEIQAIGGNNPCWVRADYLDIQGDLNDVQPVSAEHVKLPMSPYYGPLTGVSARRDGDVVTVFWNPLVLRPGDDSEQTPYVIEAWVCQNGQFIFTPVGALGQAVEVIDEPGCAETSHGRIFAAEKHGYTRGVTIPWPAHENSPQSLQSPTP